MKTRRLFALSAILILTIVIVVLSSLQNSNNQAVDNCYREIDNLTLEREKARSMAEDSFLSLIYLETEIIQDITTGCSQNSNPRDFGECADEVSTNTKNSAKGEKNDYYDYNKEAWDYSRKIDGKLVQCQSISKNYTLWITLLSILSALITFFFIDKSK